MKVGILTSGGDAPGLNAVIMGIVKSRKETEIVGFFDGWKGLMEKRFRILEDNDVDGIHKIGGTILGTSRVNPIKIEGAVEKIKSNLDELGVESLIAIGGDDTLGVAYQLYEKGINAIGVPKTIDNDVGGTDYTFGFNTAVTTATELIDKLHTTAKSHRRVMVVEIMGRYSGWITFESGLAGGAHIILIPEAEKTLDEIYDLIKKTYKKRSYCLIALSEAFKPKELTQRIEDESKVDSFGHAMLGGIGEWLAERIKQDTGIETRSIKLGHTVRGGSPSAFDRVLGLRFGAKAMDLVLQGVAGEMVALRRNIIVSVPMEEALKRKDVPLEYYHFGERFFC
jgi:6-phosphofructokinase 1